MDIVRPTEPVPAPVPVPSEVVGATTAPTASSTDSLAARLQTVTRIITSGGTGSYSMPADIPPAAPIPAAQGTTGSGLHTYAPAEGDKAKYQSYAQSKLADFGWDEAEMPYLIDLWNRESGWNPNAQNPTSTAHGIAQFLDSTWGNYGKKTDDPYAQIDAGLKYIAARYGAPSKAITFWNREHWY